MILFVFLNKHHPQGSFIAIVLGHKNLKLNLFKVPPLGNWGRGRYSYFISVVPEDNYVEMGYTRSPVWPTTALNSHSTIIFSGIIGKAKHRIHDS